MAEVKLIYGDSDSGKTTQLGFIAQYIYKKYGKKSRLISADGGGWEPLQHLVQEGIVAPLDITAEDYLLFTVRRLLKGHWVGKKKDGTRVMVPPEKARWEEFGAVFIEGTTSLGDGFMRHIGTQEVKIGTEDASSRYREGGGGNDISDYEVFATNSKGHYMVVQNEIQNLILMGKKLPVQMVVWTGHVGRGEDERAKVGKYGPQLAGSAMNLKIVKDFGEVFHLHNFPIEKKDEGGIVTIEKNLVAFYKSHPDFVTGLEYLAKSKFPLEGLEELEKQFPGGYISLGRKGGLDKYFEFVDKWIDGWLKKEKEEKENN